MTGHRDPLHCVLPPFVLESIAAHGDEAQPGWATEALNRDQSIRLARVENAKVRGRGPREGADALAAEAARVRPHRTIRDAAGREDVWGAVVRSEGDKATGNKAVDEAYGGVELAVTTDCRTRNRVTASSSPTPTLPGSGPVSICPRTEPPTGTAAR